MKLEEAKKTGAMALFGEKYENDVRVVSMGDFSKELCGGTHVENTGVITTFKIVSEAGIAAGVRRIEALTGKGVFAYYKEAETELAEAAKVVKATPANLLEKLHHLMAELKAVQSENESLKSKLAKDVSGRCDGSGSRGQRRENACRKNAGCRYEWTARSGRPVKRKTGKRNCCSCICKRWKSKPACNGNR